MMKRIIWCLVLLSIIAPVVSAEAARGCCSSHGGACGCKEGRIVCCDGSLSHTCRCDNDTSGAQVQSLSGNNSAINNQSPGQSSKSAPKSKYEKPIVTDILTDSEKEAKINEYFRTANENVGALDCDMVIHPRDVDDETKRAVKRRDHYQCVICGGMYNLEVDHMRALENGGTNDMSNLATLCDDCHTIKTKLDNSLRRKREKICRKK